MIKLLLVSPKTEQSKGGIAIWTERFLNRCNAHGIECYLVNTEVVGKRREDGTAKRNIVDETFRTIRIFKDLSEALKGNTLDVAHLNTSCGTFGLFRDYIIAKIIKKKQIRLITQFHCDVPYWINNKISKKCLKKLVSISDQRLVLCENSRLYLESNFGIDSIKVPNFVDESVIRKDEKEISKNLSTAFFVGRVEEAKGAKELYELATHFSNISFRLAGSISDTVLGWNKPTNVELLGPLPHDDIISEMDNADVFIFPSHSEGFSLALTEAMARGLPCIATDVGANKEMLENQGGVIVNVGDTYSAAIALESMQNLHKRKEMSAWNSKKVRSFYTVEAVMSQISELYK